MQKNSLLLMSESREDDVMGKLACFAACIVLLIRWAGCFVGRRQGLLCCDLLKCMRVALYCLEISQRKAPGISPEPVSFPRQEDPLSEWQS